MEKKQMTVGELKARFSEVLEDVQKGDTIEVVFGRAKKPVAMITPIPPPAKKQRILGPLRHLGPVKISDDFRMSDEELFG
jgi:antitoxin (DNA-binding transcriptional repressor) of toxin-antitoxin stability system